MVQSLNLVKEVITAVNSKVSNYEKKMRLNEIYTRTDSKSIMRMKSGQMFAREDLRRRKFVRDGPVSLRNAAGRLKGKRTPLQHTFPKDRHPLNSPLSWATSCLALGLSFLTPQPTGDTSRCYGRVTTKIPLKLDSCMEKVSIPGDALSVGQHSACHIGPSFRSLALSGQSKELPLKLASLHGAIPCWNV